MTAKSDNEHEWLPMHAQLGSTAATAAGSVDAVDALALFDALDVFAELTATEHPESAAQSEPDIDVLRDDEVRADAPFRSFRALLGSDAPLGDMLDAAELEAMQLLFDPTVADAAFDTTATAAHTDTLLESGAMPFTSTHSSSRDVSVGLAVAAAPAATKRQPAATTKTKTKTKKISSTQRLKNELIYLRNRVRALDTELTQLTAQQTSRTTDTSIGDRDSNLVDNSAERVRWAALAKRQRDAKRKAETENAMLRQRLQGQLKFAKALERMLCKRRVWDGLHAPTKQRFATLSVEDAAIFDTITQSVDARLNTVGAVFAAHGLTHSAAPRRETRLAVGANDDALCIEFVHAVVAPFAMHAVSRIVWQFLQTPEVVMNDTTLASRIVEQTDDFVLATQCVTLRDDRCARTVYFACRRVVQPTRVVFVWETFSANAVRGVPSIELTSRGVGSVTALERGALLQSCVDVMPAMPDTDSSSDSDASADSESLRHGQFTELMIAAYDANAQTARQLIENALLDDFMTTTVTAA